MALGLIRSVDLNLQKVNETKVEDYILSLNEQESNDRVLFNSRKKKIFAKHPGERILEPPRRTNSMAIKKLTGGFRPNPTSKISMGPSRVN